MEFIIIDVHVLLYSTDLNSVRKLVQCVLQKSTYRSYSYCNLKMQYICSIMVVLSLVASQMPTDQNCHIHLNANTTGSIYQYNTEPIGVTIRASVADTCTENNCIWSLNDYQAHNGYSNSCIITLNLTSNITSVSCLGLTEVFRYSISFEKIHHSE